MSKDKSREWTEIDVILGQRQSDCDNCDGKGYIEGYNDEMSDDLNIMCEQCEGHKEMTEYL